jgi:membrane-bound metal-dependent hydrolase YbcI (DUF457 family)
LVEALLHFAVPFAALRAYGLDWRRTFFVSIIALVPDLDVLLHAHRSVSHSVVVLAIIIIPILAVTTLTRNRSLTNLTLLAAVGVVSHLVLDVFGAYTPLLWPLSNQSVEILAALNFHVGSVPYFTLSLGLRTEPYSTGYFKSMDTPVITAEGLAISLVLLAPTLFPLIRNRVTLHNRKHIQAQS